MAALKVKVTGALGETPEAPLTGTVERIVVCAIAGWKPASNTSKAGNRTTGIGPYKPMKRRGRATLDSFCWSELFGLRDAASLLTKERNLDFTNISP